MALRGSISRYALGALRHADIHPHPRPPRLSPPQADDGGQAKAPFSKGGFCDPVPCSPPFLKGGWGDFEREEIVTPSSSKRQKALHLWRAF